jgi:hypothetical protein
MHRDLHDHGLIGKLTLAGNQEADDLLFLIDKEQILQSCFEIPGIPGGGKGESVDLHDSGEIAGGGESDARLKTGGYDIHDQSLGLKEKKVSPEPERVSAAMVAHEKENPRSIGLFSIMP